MRQKAQDSEGEKYLEKAIRLDKYGKRYENGAQGDDPERTDHGERNDRKKAGNKDKNQ